MILFCLCHHPLRIGSFAVDGFGLAAAIREYMRQAEAKDQTKSHVNELMGSMNVRSVATANRPENGNRECLPLSCVRTVQ